MITYVDTANVFDKIQHLFMIKALKLGLEGNFLHLIKDVYAQYTAGIIFLGERLQAVPVRSGIRKE